MQFKTFIALEIIGKITFFSWKKDIYFFLENINFQNTFAPWIHFFICYFDLVDLKVAYLWFWVLFLQMKEDSHDEIVLRTFQPCNLPSNRVPTPTKLRFFSYSIS